jgi:hypothetical protein
MFYISLKFVINLTLISGVKVMEEPCFTAHVNSFCEAQPYKKC